MDNRRDHLGTVLREICQHLYPSRKVSDPSSSLLFTSPACTSLPPVLPPLEFLFICLSMYSSREGCNYVTQLFLPYSHMSLPKKIKFLNMACVATIVIINILLFCFKTCTFVVVEVVEDVGRR